MMKSAQEAIAPSEAAVNPSVMTSGVVTQLKASTRNLDLDFWAKVILMENRDIHMSLEEMRERLIARIEYTILNGGQPDQSACENLGVPTFAQLVRANANEFCAAVVRIVNRSS